VIGGVTGKCLLISDTDTLEKNANEDSFIPTIEKQTLRTAVVKVTLKMEAIRC
jgi:hypothetical protein